MKPGCILLVLNLFIFNQCPLAQSMHELKSDRRIGQELNKKFKAFETFRISYEALKASLNTRSNVKQFEMNAGSKLWKLQLYEYDLYADNFVRLTGTDHGVIKSNEKPNVRNFYGDVLHTRGGQARITVSERFMAGFVEENGVRYYLEPVRGLISGIDDDVLVLYKESDILPNADIYCGLDLYKEYQIGTESKDQLKRTQSRGHCLEVEIAIANDFTVFTFRGGQSQAEAWNATILNLMQANWDNEFQHSLEYVQTASFTATSNASDPWNGINNINTHLDKHTSWGNGGGYGGASYDVATAWTRKYTSGAVGLAWLGVVCNSLRYNVCSDYGAGNGFLRQLQAHELGHNFSAVHDAAGSGFIMAPSVNGSNTWSNASISSINAHVNSRGCLGPCSSGTPPVADFTSDVTSGCVPFTVNFRDQSLNNPTQWLWEFPGGTPTSSTLKNPTVQYRTRGQFQVKLTVRNNFGSDVLTIPRYISAHDIPTSSFTFTKNDLTVYFRNTSQYGETYYWDFGDGNTSNDINPIHDYDEDGEYEVVLTVENQCGSKTSKQKITVVSPPVLVFFADTTFGCANFTVKFINKSSTNVTRWEWDFPGGKPSKSNAFEPSVTYSYVGEFDVTLAASNSKYNTRLIKPKYIKADSVSNAEFSYMVNDKEVKFENQSTNAKSYQWNFGDNNTSSDRNPIHTYSKKGKYNVQLITTSPCGNDTTVKEIQIGSGLAASFTTTRNGCAPHTVVFENNSIGATSYLWSFPGGDPSTSTEKNPTVVYANPGTFDVTLVVSDGSNSESVTESAYITVGQSPSSSFTHAIEGLKTYFTNTSSHAMSYHWDFGDGTESTDASPVHEYEREGEFLVKLKVSNDCGVSEFEKMISVYLIPKVNFTSNIVEVCQGDEVKFFDLSSNDVTEWLWQFAGGTPSTSTDKNPVISFYKTGIFSVSLKVKNSNGENALTKIGYIHVYSNVLCPEFYWDLWFEGSEKENLRKNPTQRSHTVPLLLSPNPFGDEILIQAVLPGGSAQINVYDIYGKLKFQQQFAFDGGVFNQTIHLKELPSGPYILEIQNANIKKAQRILKM